MEGKTFLLKDTSHTIGNLVQKSLSENAKVHYVSYHKANNNDVELFLSLKALQDQGLEKALLCETLHNILHTIETISSDFTNQL
jgi:DNA-directed RNA polymerase subunit L